MGIRYSVNEKFFQRWNHAMAYVLGFLYADGSLEDSPVIRGKYVRVSGTDYYIINKIKVSLKARHPLAVREARGNSKKQYLLRIGSKILYASLERYGLRPHKSLTMKFPKVPSTYLGSFLRGYFDGDGCVFLETGIGRKGRSILKKLSVIFTSGSRIFLEGLQANLEKQYGFLPCKVYVSHRSFQLRYNTSESLKLYQILYKKIAQQLFLKRKLEIFKRYSALKKKNGHVVK